MEPKPDISQLPQDQKEKLMIPFAMQDEQGHQIGYRGFLEVDAGTSMDDICELAKEQFQEEAHLSLEEDRLAHTLMSARKLVIADPISYEQYEAHQKLGLAGKAETANLEGQEFEVKQDELVPGHWFDRPDPSDYEL